MGNSSNKELKTVAPFPDVVPSSSPNSIYSPSGNGVRVPDDIVTRPGSANRPPSATRRADDANRPPSGTGSRRQVAAEGTLETSKSDGVLKPEPAKPRNSFGAPAGFDFNYTEGQVRRNLLADCDNECSIVTEFLYVSGAKVASSWETLSKNGITRVVNCALTVVDNYFASKPSMTYLSLNLVDSRQDDIMWFVCEVINFIEKGRIAGCKTLIHCEKGVSRSCSFVIAYIMWSRGVAWREAFEFVKARRAVCAPNTGFSCNLIEISELLHGYTKAIPLLLRCAHHLPHDTGTAVLKLCINADTRKILTPRTSLLDPRGVFVLKVGSNQSNARIFVWQGMNSSANAFTEAVRLAGLMIGVLSSASRIIVISQTAETPDFLSALVDDGAFNPRVRSADAVVYDDLFLADPIIVSRTSTPQQRMRTDQVVPEQPRISGIHIDFSREVDVFVKMRRDSRGGDNTGNSISDADSNASSALPGILSSVLSAGFLKQDSQQRPPRSKSHKRQADEMEVDSPLASTVLDADGVPSPKYQNSDPSSSVDFTDVESFRNLGANSIQALNSSITSCKLDASVDSIEAHFGKHNDLEDSGNMSVESKISASSYKAPMQIDFGLPPSTFVISSTDSSAKSLASHFGPSRPLEDSDGSGGIVLSAPFPVNSSVNLESSSGADHKELHPDHIDSPHVVVVRQKPLLYLAAPMSDNGAEKGEYIWLPMGVYDDDDLQPDSILLLVCPKAPHYLWVGKDFHVPSKSAAENAMEICDEQSWEGIVKWGSSLNSSAINFNNKGELFAPGYFSIQKQDEEADSWWTQYYEGM